MYSVRKESYCYLIESRDTCEWQVYKWLIMMFMQVHIHVHGSLITAPIKHT